MPTPLHPMPLQPAGFFAAFADDTPLFTLIDYADSWLPLNAITPDYAIDTLRHYYCHYAIEYITPFFAALRFLHYF